MAVADVANKSVAPVNIEDSGSDNYEPDDGPFDGASGPARKKPDIWVCKGCNASFPMVSWMANVRAADKTFFYFPDKRLHNIFERESEFKSLYEAGSVMLVCPYCCEKWHNEVYVNRKDPKQHRLLDNKYRRKAMNSRGMKMQDSRVAWICKHADKSNPDTEGVSCSEVYRHMAANQQVRKSTDFIYILSPWCSLFYGCSFCKVVPLRSCSWWRTARPHSEL
jgi:hypothetical protein